MIKDRKYLIGLILMVLAFVTSVIGYYMLAYTWIVYLAGSILILVSFQKIIKKILTILLPIVLYIPVTFLFLSVYNFAPSKFFLIPEKHSKTLRIIYNEECGEKYGQENGKNVIKFPKDGILILNEEFDGKSNNNDEYYFFDDNGRRHKISSEIQRSSGGASFDNSPGNDEFKDFEYLEYNIKDNIDDDFKVQQKYDSITKSKVKLCRQN